jgi:hypothetical protein
MGERGYAREELLERSSSLDSLQELLMGAGDCKVDKLFTI